MARIRTIKPGFFASEDMARLPLRARMTFAGLWTYADDYGNGNANPKLIKAALWSLDDDVTPDEVQNDLNALELNGQIVLYEVDGRSYFHVVKWATHQRVDRASKSDIPAPSTQAREDDASGSGALPVDNLKKPGQDDYLGTREDDASPRDKNPQEGEGKGEGNKGGDARGAEPPRYCSDHPKGTKAKCGPCGDARKDHESWANAERNKPTPIPPRNGDIQEHPHRWVADGTCMFDGCTVRREAA